MEDIKKKSQLKENENFVNNLLNNKNELEKNLSLANASQDINTHKPILSNRNKVTRGLALKVRNLIQNEIRFTLDPIIKNQEGYNSYNIRIINEIARYLEKLNVEKEESYDKLSVELKENYDKLSAEEKKNHDKLSAELQLNYDTLSAELQDSNYTLSEELKESHNNLINSHIKTINEMQKSFNYE